MLHANSRTALLFGAALGISGATMASSPPATPEQQSASAPAGRLVAPLSGSVVDRHPTFSWLPPTGGQGGDVEICGDRACKQIVARFPSGAPSGRASGELADGSYFWRVRTTVAGSATKVTTATWQFRVHGPAATAMTARGIDLDLNGDGFADVAVPLTLDRAQPPQVAIFLGGPAGPARTPSVVLHGPRGANGFGTAIAALGDVNGDGFGDMAVAASGAGERPLGCSGATVMGEKISTDRMVPDGTGRIYVYLGSPNGPPAQPDVALAGAESGSALGAWISGGGDIDGDGYADVIAGSAGGPPADLSCALNNGPPPSLVPPRAWLYLGRSTGLAPGTMLATNAANGGPCEYVRGAIVGDVDGDGFADAFSSCDSRVEHEGEVRFGSAAGLSARPVVRLRGAQPRGALEIALGGDFDGNGRGDVLLVPWQTLGPILRYRDFGARPAALAPAQEITPPRQPERKPVVHDFNGDGRSDLIIAIGGFTKRAYMFMGSPRGLGTKPTSIGPPSDQLRFATWVTAGDFNGDGYGDLVMAGFEKGQGDRFFFYPGGPGGLASRASLVMSATSTPQPQPTH